MLASTGKPPSSTLHISSQLSFFFHHFFFPFLLLFLPCHYVNFMELHMPVWLSFVSLWISHHLQVFKY